MNSLPAKPTSSPELLAPAGGPEAGYAALHYGADAVYLGLKRFSARAEAENFTVDELQTFTGFAHAMVPRRNVYVTLNTLIRDDETGEAAGLLYDCAMAGVDAVIVQDFGIARMALATFPELHLHASTQMAIHNRAGVTGVRQAGFARVNMARELTLDELRECSSVPGIQIETFIHGALCYSYSGLCLYSSLLRGRSGNRGGCTYPCRDRFRPDGELNSEGLFAFSMKDLALPGQIAALRDAGVSSLKIEGRKKSPLYVATATALYRKILDGNTDSKELEGIAEDLKTVFSRPWTSLFSTGRKNFDTVDDQTVGHRGAHIGEVMSVRQASSESRLRFMTRRPLEQYDGIQVDVKGEDKPFGFSAQSLYVISPDHTAGKVFETEAGTTVEVSLPPDAPLLLPGAPVYCASSQKTKQEYQFQCPTPGETSARFTLDVKIRMAPNRITANARVFTLGGSMLADGQADVEGSFEKAKNPARSENAARDAFTKLGKTPFAPGLLEFENPDGLFAPISLLNGLRRDLTALLAEKLTSILTERRRTTVASCTSNRIVRAARESTERWTLAIDRPETLNALDDSDLTGVDEVIYRLNAENGVHAAVAMRAVIAKVGYEKIRIGLPVIIRDNEMDNTIQTIHSALSLGIRRWEVSGIGGKQILDTVVPPGADMMAGWPLYALNREAVSWLLDQGYNGITVSPEDGIKNIKVLSGRFGDRVTVPVYLDPPLFIAETCATFRFSGGCPGENRCSHIERPLRSSGNERVILIRDGCRSMVLNHAPFSRAAYLPTLRAAGARHFQAEFVQRPWSAPDVIRIWREIRTEINPEFSTPLTSTPLR